MVEPAPHDRSLKPRELEVVRYMVDGLTNREIAENLYIGVETVRTYAKRIYTKLEVSNRVEAGKKAVALGLLAESPEERSALFAERHQLPAQLTPLVGRKRELEEVEEQLGRPEVRLLTILAPGGMGKTRVAVEAAKQQVGYYRDGVFFVPLRPLSDAGNIVLAIAEVLQLQFRQDERGPQEQLLDHLRRKQMLLVMDNWEHLLSGTPLLVEILKAAPGIKILATSREKLNLSAEHVFLLSGMEFQGWGNRTEALESDAVQFLLQSARRVKPEWSVTDANLDAVARVCRLTAGMPLAILLAVAWLDLLSLDEIADEIEKSADFLETELRDMPARQRSIRAVFERTWRHLRAEDRETFMKLSVFRGGFTHSAAQTTTGAPLSSFRRLVDKALLSPDDGDRYELHELLRKYGEASLQEAGQMEAVRDAHCRYHLDFLTERQGDIKGQRQVAALDEIEADFENIRVAWAWAIRQSEFARIDAAAESLMRYCEARARFVEGQDLFKQALESLPDSVQYELIRARLTITSYRLLEQPRLDDLLAKALAVAEKHESRAHVAMSLFVYGRSSWLGRQQQYEEALRYFERALEINQNLGDDFCTASAVNRVGLCHFLLLNQEEGLRLTEQSAHLQRKIGDLHGLGISLNNLGGFHFLLDRVEESVAFLRESVELGRRSRNAGNLTFSQAMLSQVLFSTGAFSEARDLASLASNMARDIGYMQSESLGVCTLGLLASVADEEYEAGLEISHRALQLASRSNVTIESVAHSAIALALCGLGRVETVSGQVRQLTERLAFRRSIFHTGLLAAIWSVYCCETAAYQKSTRFLSFLSSERYETFGWTATCSLLRSVSADLQARLDETTFDTLWEEGRRMPVDEAWAEILADQR